MEPPKNMSAVWIQEVRVGVEKKVETLEVARQSCVVTDDIQSGSQTCVCVHTHSHTHTHTKTFKVF
jgi:hypothetical protein